MKMKLSEFDKWLLLVCLSLFSVPVGLMIFFKIMT